MRDSLRHSTWIILTLIAPGIMACSENPGGPGFDSRTDVLPDLNRVPAPQYEVAHLTSAGTPSGANGINNRGWVAGFSTTVEGTREATLWRNGSSIQLGTLGGPNSNVPWPGLNNGGMVVGISQTGEPEPLNQSFSCGPFLGGATGEICRGFVWESGEMTPMPTLGGHNSFATDVNSRGQVVGWAETAIHGPTCEPPSQVLQFRAVLWEPRKDRIRELPPLSGDSVSAATAINNRGQVVGISGACGVAVGGVSARHAVLWEKGSVNEIGDLGGAAWNTPMDINARGEVVGFALAADGSALRAFYWNEGDGVRPLGTLEGDVGSQALGINARGQVVGLSNGADGSSAVIWLDGEAGEIIDLNSLVGPDYAGHLISAGHINGRGMITGHAVDAVTGETVTFVARPIRGRGWR